VIGGLCEGLRPLDTKWGQIRDARTDTNIMTWNKTLIKHHASQTTLNVNQPQIWALPVVMGNSTKKKTIRFE